MAALVRSSWEFTSAGLNADSIDGGIWDAVTGVSITPVVAAALNGAGDRGLRVNPSGVGAINSVNKRFATSGNTNDSYHKFDFQVVTSPNTQTQIISLDDFGAGAASCSIRINTDNTLELWNENAGSQIGSDSSALAAATTYRIELGYVNSTRVITAYVDGVSFASGTLDVAADNIDQVFLGIGAGTNGIAATGEWYFDSYCCNDQNTGGDQTGLPGNQLVVLRMVNAAGDNAMGARGGTDSGSDFGQLNQKPPDDLVTYYILDANNDTLDLGFEDASELVANGIPAGSTINCLQVIVRHRIPAGTNPFGYNGRFKTQSGGTLASGTTIAHNDITWKTNGDNPPRIPSLSVYVDPQGGGPLTIALLDGAQIGVIATDAEADMELTTLGAYIGYTPSTGTVRDLIMGPGIIPFVRS